MNGNIPEQDVKQYLGYIGFRPGDSDCKPAGMGAYMIPCPFHNDTNPSLAIYPNGGYCYSGCGSYYNLAYIAHKIKNIPYHQALKDLGADTLTKAEKVVEYRVVETPRFCEPNEDAHIEAFQKRHEQCSKEYPPEMLEWLERKKLTEQARELDWRWHDGSLYKYWGKGIVIPYFDPVQKGKLVYERFRAWNEEEHKFDKVVSPCGTKSQPYLSTFRPNKRQWLCEGESDCASLYAMGESALGFPGSTAKKVINTVLALLNDISVVEEIILCGDSDDAGRGMNMYIKDAAKKIAPRLRISVFKHTLTENKADMNDEYVKGVLELPVSSQDKPQVEEPEPEPKPEPVEKLDEAKVEEIVGTFSGYVDELDAYLRRCELYGVDPWTNNASGLGELNPSAISDSLADLPIVDIKEPRYHDRAVLIARYHISGHRHFLVEIQKGAYAGLYHCSPDCIAKGWYEEMNAKSGGKIPMLVVELRNLINLEDLDLKEA